MKSIANLLIGEKATIVGYRNEEMALPFLEMGLHPGCEISLYAIAPGKDPIYLKMSGSGIAIRKEDAKNVLITQ